MAHTQKINLSILYSKIKIYCTGRVLLPPLTVQSRLLCVFCLCPADPLPSPACTSLSSIVCCQAASHLPQTIDLQGSSPSLSSLTRSFRSRIVVLLSSDTVCSFLSKTQPRIHWNSELGVKGLQVRKWGKDSACPLFETSCPPIFRCSAWTWSTLPEYFCSQ